MILTHRHRLLTAARPPDGKRRTTREKMKGKNPSSKLLLIQEHRAATVKPKSIFLPYYYFLVRQPAAQYEPERAIYIQSNWSALVAEREDSMISTLRLPRLVSNYLVGPANIADRITLQNMHFKALWTWRRLLFGGNEIWYKSPFIQSALQHSLTFTPSSARGARSVGALGGGDGVLLRVEPRDQSSVAILQNVFCWKAEQVQSTSPPSGGELYSERYGSSWFHATMNDIAGQLMVKSDRDTLGSIWITQYKRISSSNWGSVSTNCGENNRAAETWHGQPWCSSDAAALFPERATLIMYSSHVPTELPSSTLSEL